MVSAAGGLLKMRPGQHKLVEVTHAIRPRARPPDIGVIAALEGMSDGGAGEDPLHPSPLSSWWWRRRVYKFLDVLRAAAVKVWASVRGCGRQPVELGAELEPEWLVACFCEFGILRPAFPERLSAHLQAGMGGQRDL